MRSAVPKDIVDGYYRELFDALDHRFCTVEVLFDDARNALDYRFAAVNATFEAQTGLGHVVGRRMSEPAPAHEHWFHIYGEVARNGESKRFEAEASHDITARKRAEPAIEVAEREAERARRTKDELVAMLDALLQERP